MVEEEAANKIEVVSDKQNQESPFQVSRGIHANNEHYNEQLEKKSWLKDAIIPKEPNCIIVFIQVLSVCHNVLRCRKDAHAFLEPVVHYGEMGQHKVLVRT